MLGVLSSRTRIMSVSLQKETGFWAAEPIRLLEPPTKPRFPGSRTKTVSVSLPKKPAFLAVEPKPCLSACQRSQVSRQLNQNRVCQPAKEASFPGSRTKTVSVSLQKKPGFQAAEPKPCLSACQRSPVYGQSNQSHICEPSREASLRGSKARFMGSRTKAIIYVSLRGKPF